MPYIAEKTGVFNVYEDYLDDLEHRLEMLVNLRNLNVRLSDKPVLEASSLPTPGNLAPGQTKADWYKQHVHRDWHGSPVFNAGTWVQPAGQTTGWWQRWFGPAEKILRESFLRAIEVSLGLAHRPPSQATRPDGAPDPDERPALHVVPEDAPVRAEVTRFWPIEILWVCGSPMLQGWVTWRQHGVYPAAGQVTLLLTTPWPLWGHPLNLNPTPDTPPQPPADRDYKVDPGTVQDVAHPRGMWVIGAEETKVREEPEWDGDAGGAAGAGTGATPQGGGADDDAGYSRGWYRGGGLIVTVRPTEADGGVLNRGRRYTP
jgi:hypothetical protein